MTNRWLLEQLETALKRLHVSIRVSDQSPDEPIPRKEEIPGILPDGVCVREASRVWLSVRQQDLLLSCPEGVPQAEDLLLLAESLVNSLAAEHRDSGSIHDAYRRILLGDLLGAEIEALRQEHDIPLNRRRCVLVFHFVNTGGGSASDLLRNLPPAKDSMVIDMDRHTAAVIMDTERGCSG